MRIGCLLSVRDKATRLPNKVFLDLAGMPLIIWLLNRLKKKCNEIVDVVVSTSTHPNDKKLVDLAHSAGFKSFCGSEQDKLSRYLNTAEYYNFDVVIIVDGDDPFCFPEGVDAISLEMKGDSTIDCAYISGLPVGAGCVGLSIGALRKIMSIKDEIDTEVWGGYFIGSGYFNVKQIRLDNPFLSDESIRLTVDYLDDYKFTQEVIKGLNNSFEFSSAELMELLINKNPELRSINSDAQALYEAHLGLAAPVKFKDRHGS